MSTLTTAIQHIIINPSQKTFKLEKVLNSIFTDDKILYFENPKDSTPRLLELIQQFGSVAGYKINAQKSVAFL